MLDDQNNLKLNIISAICNMDVEGLKMYLPNDELYFEMKKNTFLDKINVIFDELKFRGNTCFSIHPGQCNSSICSNKGCNGLAFVSDFTKEHISIVLHYKEDIFDDWSHCHNMSISTITLDEEKSIYINVWNEEKHDFVADDDFLQTIFDVKQAKILLGDLSHIGISKSSLLMWLDRYEKLFKESDYFYRIRYMYYKSFSEFGELFFSLVKLGSIVKNESKVISVIEQMKYTKRKRHLQLYDDNEELLSNLICVNIYRENGLINLTSEGVVYHFDHQNFKELFDYIELSHDLIYKYHH